MMGYYKLQSFESGSHPLLHNNTLNAIAKIYCSHHNHFRVEEEEEESTGIPMDWEAESISLASDLTFAVPVFALFFFVVRLTLDAFVFERFGRKFIVGYSSSKRFTVESQETNRKKLIKFKESAWKFVYYLTAEILALAVTYNEPWFLDTKYFWVGPGDQRWPEQSTKLKLKLLYAFAGGFYTYSIVALVFWETRRSDFSVSMAHHVATLSLILLSYMAKLARVGSIVLAVHDASDIVLEIGKLTKYCGLEIVPSISFVVFALSWILLRLFYFPFYIIWSTTYEALQFVDKELRSVPVVYYVLNSLLLTLQVLHVYWWILIWRMAVRQIQASGKVSEDVRSDSDNDSDTEDKIKRKN